MNEDFKLIKKIDPIDCPHCGKMIYIGSQSMPSTISSIGTDADLKATKEEIKQRISEIKFANDEEANNIISWLDKDETLLDRSDIEPMIKQIQMDQLNIIQNQRKENNEENNSKI